ncbi:MAG: hypothetical protein PHE94_03855 [Eubacteriales bacterium]|nr:hypothetical protein [Eubacteriales bacterium]
MSKPIIERVKSISLVVLFLSTVLLLCFFWGKISFDGIESRQEASAEEIPNISYMIKPDQIVVNFCADNYTVIMPEQFDDIWYSSSEKDSIIKEIERFGQTENIMTEEITDSQYQEVMKFRSIQAKFSYDIPTADFFLNYKISKHSNYDVIETITYIGYSTASEKNLFIYDGKNQKYYRLVADTENADFKGLIASIEAEGYNIYYPISLYLGVDNKTLIPLEMNINVKGFSFRQDLYPYQTEKIDTIAENFFGGNLDFVREITEDSGTVIYMYGYGKTVLIVNTDGSIEYKEEQINDDVEQSFLGALETAVIFIANHGSWDSLNGAKLTPYLKDVSVNPNNKKGFRFTFGMEANGNRLYYEAGESMVIDVTGGQVTYYKRNMIDFDEEELETIETSSAETAFSPVNLIAKNYEFIYHILEASDDKNVTADHAAMFEQVSSSVNNMQIGYVRMADKAAMDIEPAWIVSIKKTTAYFNLYSAEPIGYTKE